MEAESGAACWTMEHVELMSMWHSESLSTQSIMNINFGGGEWCCLLNHGACGADESVAQWKFVDPKHDEYSNSESLADSFVQCYHAIMHSCSFKSLLTRVKVMHIHKSIAWMAGDWLAIQYRRGQCLPIICSMSRLRNDVTTCLIDCGLISMKS